MLENTGQVVMEANISEINQKIEQVVSFVGHQQDVVCDINRKMEESAYYTKELILRID